MVIGYHDKAHMQIMMITVFSSSLLFPLREQGCRGSLSSLHSKLYYYSYGKYDWYWFVHMCCHVLGSDVIPCALQTTKWRTNSSMGWGGILHQQLRFALQAAHPVIRGSSQSKKSYKDQNPINRMEIDFLCTVDNQTEDELPPHAYTNKCDLDFRLHILSSQAI